MLAAENGYSNWAAGSDPSEQKPPPATKENQCVRLKFPETKWLAVDCSVDEEESAFIGTRRELFQFYTMTGFFQQWNLDMV